MKAISGKDDDIASVDPADQALIERGLRGDKAAMRDIIGHANKSDRHALSVMTQEIDETSIDSLISARPDMESNERFRKIRELFDSLHP